MCRLLGITRCFDSADGTRRVPATLASNLARKQLGEGSALPEDNNSARVEDVPVHALCGRDNWRVVFLVERV